MSWRKVPEQLHTNMFRVSHSVKTYEPELSGTKPRLVAKILATNFDVFL